MIPTSTIIAQAAYQAAPVPNPLSGAVWVMTGVLRFYRYYTTAKTEQQPDWSTVLTAFGYLVVQNNDKAKRVVQVLCVCIIVQELIQLHLALSDSWEDLWNSVNGTFSSYKKRAWNQDVNEGKLSFLSPSTYLWKVETIDQIPERIKKVARCIIKIFKQLFFLSERYLTAYDLAAFNDPLTQYGEIKKLCLDPNKPIKLLISNETAAMRLLDKHQELVNQILETAGSEYKVEGLKEAIVKAIKIQNQVTTLVNKGSVVVDLAKELAKPFEFKPYDPMAGIIDDSVSDNNSLQVKLGLVEEEKRPPPEPFPFWVGQEVPKEKAPYIPPEEKVKNSRPEPTTSAPPPVQQGGWGFGDWLYKQAEDIESYIVSQTPVKKK